MTYDATVHLLHTLKLLGSASNSFDHPTFFSLDLHRFDLLKDLLLSTLRTVTRIELELQSLRGVVLAATWYGRRLVSQYDIVGGDVAVCRLVWPYSDVNSDRCVRHGLPRLVRF